MSRIVIVTLIYADFELCVTPEPLTIYKPSPNLTPYPSRALLKPRLHPNFPLNLLFYFQPLRGNDNT
jgi:hypothetical protein